MKFLNRSLLFAAVAMALFLPAPRSQSQLAPPTDPMAAIQALQTTNDDLLKRQEATLKDLSDMTETAREVRIYARRG